MTSTSGQPKVSFVTPFYNTAQYLAECIESVLKQSYDNWEYLLVNNCSTDGSFEIAEQYTERDSRIRLITNTIFLSQVANYNHALRQISPTSEFVKMVQADDWLFPECTARMIEVAAGDSVIAMVGAYSLRHSFIGCVGLPYPSTTVSGEIPLRLHLLEGKTVVGTPTNVLYRADLVRDRADFFPVDSILDDLEVCYEILPGRKFGFVHQILTYVREDNPSISTGLLAYNPWPLHRLILIRKYGRDLLSSQEYQESLEKVERSYMRFLGYAKLTGRSKEFWDYQEKAFSAMNLPLSSGRLLRESVGAAIDIVGNPIQSWQRLKRHRKRASSNGEVSADV